MKRNEMWIGITIGICTLILVMLILLIVSINFKDVMTIPQSYCESSGGQWNFYECQNIPPHYCLTPEFRTGYWCDYKDGTSKSEEDIERIFNSTTMVLT